MSQSQRPIIVVRRRVLLLMLKTSRPKGSHSQLGHEQMVTTGEFINPQKTFNTAIKPSGSRALWIKGRLDYEYITYKITIRPSASVRQRATFSKSLHMMQS